VAPEDGGSRWVVVDPDYALHVEATAFLAGLQAADRSVNTERVYAGRVASDAAPDSEDLAAMDT